MSRKSKIEPVHHEEAEKLKALFTSRAGMSQDAFGAKFDIGTQGMVWQYLNARSALNLKVAVKFARGLGCSVAEFSPRLAALLEPTSTPRRDKNHDDINKKQGESNAEPAPRLGASVKIPVVGSAQLGDNGFRSELEYPVGHGDGYVEHASRDPQAYALRCVGDSMKPRIKDGEFVIVYPNHPAGPGDEVLVRFTDGRVMIKELLYVRDDVMHLLSVNEAHGKVTAPVSEVEKVHYVAGIVKKAQWMPN